MHRRLIETLLLCGLVIAGAGSTAAQQKQPMPAGQPSIMQEEEDTAPASPPLQPATPTRKGAKLAAPAEDNPDLDADDELAPSQMRQPIPPAVAMPTGEKRVRSASHGTGTMPEGGAMLTLTYNGGLRAMPNYNAMGLAKAALEASVRYLAVDFGGSRIRVNAISSGPIRTLAGAGIGDARMMFAFQQRHSVLHRGVTLDELGGAGLYLLSDLSTGVTGEIHFVDCGYNVIAMPHPDALRADRERAED